MRRISTFLSLVLFSGSLAVAQVATPAPPVPFAVEAAPLPGPVMRTTWDSGGILPALMGGTCVGKDALGSASNVFTNILSESNPVAVNNEVNSIVYIHRNNASVFGGSSGNFRYDLSTNGGLTWSNNQGPVNPLLTQPGRYPSVAIYNPAGNTNPALARLQYYGPTVLGSAFDVHVSGGRNLDGTANTEFYNQIGTTQNLIPRGLCNGAPGVMWAVDFVYTGTAYTGFRILKGTWSGSDMVWTVNSTITPSFNIAYDGIAKVSDMDIAFDPSGQVGYVALLSHLTPGPTAFGYYPCFWSTTDGGVTWSGPEQVDIGQYSCYTANITAGNFVGTAFDINLQVDYKGNPHAFVGLCNGNNAYAVFFTSWHHVFDITKEQGMWNLVDMANVNAGRTTFGVAPNTVSYDMEPQVSRSDDGSKIFFTWVGSEGAIPLGGTNVAPNLWAMGYDVAARNWTVAQELTSCNPATAGKAFFPKMANNVYGTSSPWELPVVISEMTSSDPLLVANMSYLDSLAFTSTMFSVPQCTAAVSISGADSLTICEGDSVSLFSGGAHEAYLWSDGGTTAGITILATPGWHYLTGRTACCIGIDSVFITIDDTVIADYSFSSTAFTADFTDLSDGSPASWSWDMGDGATYTIPNPSHTYAAEGTYYVCLTVTDACGTHTYCDSVEIVCPAPVADFSASVVLGTTVDFTDLSTSGSSWAWDFGDGGTSTLQNPSHSYSVAGTYWVCLTVSDSCGADTLCDSVLVDCPDPTADFSYLDLGLGLVDFTDLSSSATSWFWDFGDGGTSTLQNPSHTYATTGWYYVCLTATDSCGSNTTCDTLFIIIEGTSDASFSNLRVYPNPASDVVNIEGYISGNKAVQITLRDALGRALHLADAASSASRFRSEISLSGIPAGVYLLEIRSGNTVNNVKLIVQ